MVDFDSESEAEERKQTVQGLLDSIPESHHQLTVAAKAIQTISQQNDWDAYRPFLELIFYLAHIDYEMKVLLSQTLSQNNDRSIWEKYLALALYESIETLPKAVGQFGQQIHKSPSSIPSTFDPEKFSAASKSYKEAVRPIKQDNEFWNGLRTVRNHIAGHHLGRNGRGFTSIIAWIISNSMNLENNATAFNSQIVEYAVRATSAVQAFGSDLAQCSKR